MIITNTTQYKQRFLVDVREEGALGRCGKALVDSEIRVDKLCWCSDAGWLRCSLL